MLPKNGLKPLGRKGLRNVEKSDATKMLPRELFVLKRGVFSTFCGEYPTFFDL